VKIEERERKEKKSTAQFFMGDENFSKRTSFFYGLPISKRTAIHLQLFAATRALYEK
jgi:hypothetical protein